MIAWLYRKLLSRYPVRVAICDRRPLDDPWLPRRTFGEVLDEQDLRREW